MRRALFIATLLVASTALAGCPTKKSEEVVTLDPLVGGVNAAAYELPKLRQEKLSNGLEILLIEDHRLPIVIMGVTIRSGDATDPPDKAGLNSTMMAMLEKGTERKTALEIAEAIDFVGGQLQASSDDDSASVAVKVLEKDFAVGLDLLQDVVMRPTFPAEQLQIVQQAQLAGVKQRFQSPQALGAYHIKTLVYGENHPYSFATSERSIASITVDDLKAHHAAHMRPNNAYLVVAGDINSDEVYRKVKLAFGPWEKKATPKLTLPTIPAPKRQVRIVDKPDLTQSTIYVAHRGVSTRDEDYYPAVLMNYALGGGGFSSRLMKKVRSEGGKTYGVGSKFSANKYGGYFVATTSTRNAETLNTLELVLGELENVKKNGITSSELAEGKGKLVGSYQVRMETLSAKVERIIAALVHERGLDSVRNYRRNMASVTLEQANAAATEHLSPDGAAIVVVGKAADIQADLEKKFGAENVNVVSYLEYAHGVDQAGANKKGTKASR